MRRIKKILASKLFITGILIIAQIVVMFVGIYLLSQWLLPVYIILTIMDILVVLYVVNANISPAYKINWLIISAIFPLASGVLYLMFGSRRVPPKFRREHLASVLKFKPLLKNDEVLSEVSKGDESIYKQIKYINDYSYFPLYKYNKSTYYPTGESMFEALLEDMKEAKHYIYIEMFILQQGKLLNAILEVLEEKVKEGVDVRLIYDDIGSAMYLSRDFNRLLKEKGIKYQMFNPMRPILLVTMNNRDHRKLVVIDGNVGYTGGLNFGDEYINEVSLYGLWKDAGIRIEGTAVKNMTVMFLQFWQASTEQIITLPEGEPVVEFTEEKGYVQPFSDSPTDSEDVSKTAHLNMIWSAKHHLYIMTPYFVVDNETLSALKQASKNGIDVRIILPHVPDKVYMLESARSYYKELISAGVKVYEYTPGFIHSKVMMADDRIAIVGTINMDYRSYYLNFECATLLYKTKALKDIRKDFDRTFEESQLIDMADCLKIPLYKVIIRAVLKLFAPIM